MASVFLGGGGDLASLFLDEVDFKFFSGEEGREYPNRDGTRPGGGHMFDEFDISAEGLVDEGLGGGGQVG